MTGKRYAEKWHRDVFVISTDQSRLDLDLIHRELARSYWAAGIPRQVVLRSIENSLSFGVYTQGKQVGFARVITDFATFGYLADVFILQEFQGKGLGKWLIETILAHPELQGFRRWLLATRDAHGLYRKCGFDDLEQPEYFMAIYNHDVYAGSQR